MCSHQHQPCLPQGSSVFRKTICVELAELELIAGVVCMRFLVYMSVNFAALTMCAVVQL